MRISVFAFIAAAFALGVVSSSCENEVLLDANEHKVLVDSTKIRILDCVPDTVKLGFNTTRNWTATVAKGGEEWCTLSKTEGRKGNSSVLIYVKENPTASARQTSIVLVSGEIESVFKITQKAGEPWFEEVYWNRTASQRAGLRGKVKSMTETNNLDANKSVAYYFDERGNLTKTEINDMRFDMYDTTKVFEYDDENHRLSCAVKMTLGDDTLRSWRYEYANKGKLVAYSAVTWDDPDPLAEDMTGMVVPDLSAVYKTWTKDNLVYNESRKYTFDGNRLQIALKIWRDFNDGTDSIEMLKDTVVKVSYRESNTSKLTLPYTSSNVSNCTYDENGMLKMLVTKKGRYDFLDNVQKMVVESFMYNENAESVQNEPTWYECKYNYNRDITERQVTYSGMQDITVEKYPRYQYDENHNWINRVEQVPKPGQTESHDVIRNRVISYHR